MGGERDRRKQKRLVDDREWKIREQDVSQKKSWLGADENEEKDDIEQVVDVLAGIGREEGCNVCLPRLRGEHLNAQDKRCSGRFVERRYDETDAVFAGTKVPK